jgi:hypothetical protein
MLTKFLATVVTYERKWYLYGDLPIRTAITYSTLCKKV